MIDVHLTELAADEHSYTEQQQLDENTQNFGPSVYL
jgi:hypothetical protein